MNNESMTTPKSMEEFSLRLKVIVESVDQTLISNASRLSAYSDVEILRMEFEEYCATHNIPASSSTQIIENIDKASSKLHLVPRASDAGLISTIAAFFRFFLFLATLIVSGTIGSIVLLYCRSIDSHFKEYTSGLLCDRVRQFIARAILTIIGINIEVEGLQNTAIDAKCVILTFSHASNFDGFLICATWPIRLLAFAKKELFMVPFFSWISFAMGGVPVDRQNRDVAVRTLRRVVDRDRNSNVGFVIAPEGTRSVTGQLQPFKKGAFHMWEDLKVPVVPIIFFGGFDLWQGKNWINNTGNIVVRYLDPIYADQADSRDKMMSTVRRRMLESFKLCPSKAATPLSSDSQTMINFSRVIFLLFLYFLASSIQLALRIMNMSAMMFMLYSSILSVIITVALYRSHMNQDAKSHTN